MNDSVMARTAVNGTVEPIAFVDGLAEDPFALEFWTATMTRAPGDPPRVYEPGEMVIATDGELYRATVQNSDAPPADNPDAWEQLPDPVDDLRVVPGSTYEGWGIR